MRYRPSRYRAIPDDGAVVAPEPHSPIWRAVRPAELGTASLVLLSDRPPIASTCDADPARDQRAA